MTDAFHFAYISNNFDVDDHVSTQNNLRTILLLTSFALLMTPEDVHNMNETGLFYHAQPNKTLSARKISRAQNLEGTSHSCS